tara:strand:- start:164 stop:925 length:762 start_codon:yes stop_codon:yes gene_type:complete
MQGEKSEAIDRYISKTKSTHFVTGTIANATAINKIYTESNKSKPVQYFARDQVMTSNTGTPMMKAATRAQSTAYDNKIHGKAIPKKINILKDDMIVRLTSPFTAKQADKTTITIPMGSIGTVKSQSAHVYGKKRSVVVDFDGYGLQTITDGIRHICDMRVNTGTRSFVQIEIHRFAMPLVASHASHAHAVSNHINTTFTITSFTTITTTIFYYYYYHYYYYQFIPIHSLTFLFIFFINRTRVSNTSTVVRLPS